MYLNILELKGTVYSDFGNGVIDKTVQISH